MAADVTLGEAARALRVSLDTLRRWDRDGKIRTTRDQHNRRRVPATEIERLRTAPPRHRTGATLSARNRFPGVVTSVESDGVMALVEIEAGPVRGTPAGPRGPGGGMGPLKGGQGRGAGQGAAGEVGGGA